jgi:serine/threonine-protein kinase
VAFAAAHIPPASKGRATIPPGVPSIRPAATSIVPLTGSVPPPSRRSLSKLMLAAAALVGVVAVLFVVLVPSSGELVVTSEGGDKSVAVFVDGQKRCEQTPCTVADLEEGTHLVRTSTGADDDTAERAINVAAGATATHHVTLADDPGGAALRVVADGEGLTVSVDGKDLGAPPLSLDDAAPGEHLVRVSGPSDAFEAYEERVTLRPGEVRTLGPVRLKVLKVKLTLDAEDDSVEGAGVAIDGKVVGPLPTTVELDADAPHELVVSRPGYETHTESLAFDQGVSQRSMTLSLTPVAHAARATRTRAVSSRRTSAPPARSRAAKRASAAGGAQGTLSLNSIPAARVVVDGRPLGVTPVAAVRVSPGSHTVVFVHPEKGRKIVTATVAPGGRATAAVRF